MLQTNFRCNLQLASGNWQLATFNIQLPMLPKCFKFSHWTTLHATRSCNNFPLFIHHPICGMLPLLLLMQQHNAPPRSMGQPFIKDLKVHVATKRGKFRNLINNIKYKHLCRQKFEALMCVVCPLINI